MTTASESAAQSPDAVPSEGGEIVARAGRYYRNARYVMALICVAGGLWFAYDGFIGWPKENSKYDELTAQIAQAQAAGNKDAEAAANEQRKPLKKHTAFDLQLQKILAFSLPVVGLGILAWALYNSRGAYRFADNTLYVPGHPPVPVENIRQIDKEKWDRKGIAFIDYEVPGTPGQTARLRLDDFVYQREPTDAILARVEALVAPAVEDADGGEASTSDVAAAEQDHEREQQ